MSDPKIISPLLDGFTLGAPISEHHGVICCPAIKENSSKKYIVKIISVPATQAQFDALLLAGAYKDPGDAMGYFKETGENILKEAEILKDLSKLEGFLPYDGWQMEPITRRRLGYKVYLVGSYKRSLDKYIRNNAITHLEAVNLGLDLCAALSVCRQSGYLYTDLKPSNIYVSEKKEFRIGDIGFLSLDALRYASLPERCFSPYTPPELLDPMAPMNLTVDTFAVGMILYQLYNDGHLPFTGTAPLEELPSPCHADYEMAEIIMKALHPDPEQRWNDPKDLGKAIASYMQRNSINDVAITPFIPVDVKPEDIVVISEKNPEEETVTPEPVQDAAEVPVSPEQETSVPMDPLPEDAIYEEEKSCPDPLEELPEQQSVVNGEPDETEKPESNDPVPEMVEDIAASDTTQPENIVVPEAPATEEELSSENLSDEVAKIISKADDIIAHEIPEETVFPIAEDLADPFAFAKEDSEEPEDDLPADPLMEEEPQEIKPEKKKKTKHFENSSRKKKIRKFFSRCFSFLLFCAVCAGGYWYYQNAYLQTIDSMSISGTQDQITVLVNTSVEESKLTAYCTGANGKQRSSAVQGGKASFTGLEPSTQYTIHLDMSGFHKLVGQDSGVFTTEATTQVLDFQATGGSEDGSVNLSFTVDGQEPNFWNIRYSADGEEQKVETVTSHSAMITGLSIGKVYTFTLDGGDHFDLGGKTSIQYLASRLILAEDITVTSSNGTDLAVHWKTPGDVVLENWNVRFFDGYGFEEQVTVSENSALFAGVNFDSHYTVEITAAGMTKPSRFEISADPISVFDFQIEETTQRKLKLTWSFEGDPPEGGWLLNYTVEGGDNQVVSCSKLPVEIPAFIPGANYEFVLQAADERTVFNDRIQYQAKDAEAFSEFKYTSENVSCDLLKTPEDPNWHFESVSEDAFTNTFRIGDSASMILKSSTDVYLPGNKISALFLFRNSYGNVLTDLISETSYTWKNIWIDGDKKIGELNIPKLPSYPGEYVLELYFNNCLAATASITMTE